MSGLPSLRHLAIIMDGNGRWASKQGLPRIDGHAAGAKATIETVQACYERGVQELSLYTLSTENTKRPAEEVTFLTRLLTSTCLENKDNFHNKGIRVRIVGAEEQLKDSQPLMQVKQAIESLTQNNDSMRLNILFNYSGRWETTKVCEQVIAQSKEADWDNSQLPEVLTKAFKQSMRYDPDLCIRTGGEQRLSNFMLWQLAYTELYFTNKLWPDFSTESLDAAIANFHARKRRYGLLENPINEQC
jgi:undecaprenyl diphosphate synthase